MRSQAAIELADQLKAESDRLLHTDPDRALHTAERIAALAESAQDIRIRALGELAVADALRMLGRFGDALNAYARSAELYTQAQDDVGWARTRIGAAVTWRYTGVGPQALGEIERARAILERHQLWLRLARLEQHAGILLSVLGQFELATRAYERALDAARKLDPRDEPQEARILGNLALAWQRLGGYERAEALHTEALVVFESHGHVQELALAQANSAQLLLERAHYSRALEMATSARRKFLDLGKTSDAAFVGRVLTHCLLELNRFEDAIALATSVAGEFEAASAAINRAATLLLRSTALRRLERYTQALDDLDAAERVFAASDCQGWVAVVRAERAALLGAHGDWQAAAAEAVAAARQLESLGQVVSAAQAQLVHATALRHLGERAVACTVIDQVLSRVEGRGLPWLEYQAQRAAAEFADEAGDDDAALSAFEAAVRALEQVQGRILTEARATFLADKVDVYEATISKYLDRGEYARAFQFAERGKSRALVDALAGQLDIRIRPATAAQQRLGDELTRLRRRREQLATQATSALVGGGETDSDPREVSSDDLADCERRITQLLDELRLNNVADLERVALLQGQVYGLELDNRTRVLEYFALGEDLCAFVQSSERIVGWRLSGARRRVERLAAKLHLSMQTTAITARRTARLDALEANAQRILRDLYDAVIRPVSDALHKTDRLIVVPHGVLHRVPFAALHDGERSLIERFELVHGPSASALAFCRRPLHQPTGRAVVVAHSNDGALPGAVREAQQIAALFGAESYLEQQATRAAVVDRARGADVIHLAAHGAARLDAPLFSYIRLADGQLTALDCFDMELDCALVALSACDSGQGTVVAGDESIGLPRALLYAGARSVLQTLWRIDDETTADLMERFYRGLQGGLGRAESLRDAQLGILHSGSGQSHPFFWAAAVLIGDWSPLPLRSALNG